MKKRFLLIFCVFLTIVCFACKKTDGQVSNEGENTSNADSLINIRGNESPTIEDVSEAYAILMADSLNHWGIEIDFEVFRKAFHKALGKEISYDDMQVAEFIYSHAVNEAIQKRKERLKAENEAFMEENAKKPGIQTFESGLQLEVLSEGTGKMPVAKSTCKLHYVGSLIDGKVFDDSRKIQGDEPVSFDLDSVIPAWQEGLTYMKVGGKYKLYVPYDLAYGADGIQTERAEIIPPYSALIFEIELLDTIPPRNDPTKKPIAN